jgi:RNA polymerase sigma-70 factor (ECF subfamily)
MEAASRAAVSAVAPEEHQAVESLVGRAQEGDADAFGLLYDRFQPEILRYLTNQVGHRETAEDLAQQVFLRAWQAIPRYEQRGAPFKAWLYRMARNQVIDHFRRQRPTSDLEGIEVAEPAEAEDRVLAAELRGRLRAALDGLSPDHREVLVLRFLMEKSAAEIGQIMNRKEVTVRGLQMRALQALRKQIAAIGGLP